MNSDSRITQKRDSQAMKIPQQNTLFLTQENFSPLRKKARQVKQYAQQVQKGQLWQMNKLCDKLLQQVNQIKTQEVLSLYRQLNRNLTQNFIQKEGQMNKLQKINTIDIEYLKKKIDNEPQTDFSYLNNRVDAVQSEIRQVSQIAQEYSHRVLDIQKQFG